MTILYIFVRVSYLRSRGQCISSLRLVAPRYSASAGHQAVVNLKLSPYFTKYLFALYISKQILIGVLFVSVFYGFLRQVC